MNNHQSWPTWFRVLLTYVVLTIQQAHTGLTDPLFARPEAWGLSHPPKQQQEGMR